MSEKINLLDAERSAVRLSTQDGLWEILLGIILLSLGASNIVRDQWGFPWIYLPLVLVIITLVPGMRMVKKALTIPRIGLVQFNPQRKAKFKRVNTLLTSLVLFTFIVILLPKILNFGAGMPALPYWFIDALFGLLVVGFFTFLSFALETRRVFFYGLIFGASMPGDVIYKQEFGSTFPMFSIIAGFVILVSGIVVLVRFLRQFPIPETGERANER
ncbi:MAG: hypothetical protein OEY93_02595 [Anaerolineae bacterium]|nr:hypothetical protein [Anaerolineae bacterium]